MPFVCVVVVNYNGGAYLKRCLLSLKNQTFQNFEVVVVDNASEDQSLDFALPDDPRFKLHKLKSNLGFAAGNNIGTRESDTPWVATLNPDAFPHPDWLARLMDAVERHPEAVMFGSTQLADETIGILDGVGDFFFAPGVAWRGGHGHPVSSIPPEGEVFSPCAAAALYKRETLERLGGFDERFFCYYEDIDLAFRIRLDGGYCIQVPDAIVRHVGSGITGRNSDFAQYHGNRNRIWAFVKNMPSPLIWFLLPAHIFLIFYILCVSSFRGYAFSSWSGVFDAMNGLPEVLRERTILQARRKISWTVIAGSLCWNPVRVFKRDSDVRYKIK